MVEAITFDFWNTLFVAVRGGDLRLRQVGHALVRAGYAHVPALSIERAMDSAWKEWDRVWEQEYRTFGAAHWVSLILDDLDLALGQPDKENLVQDMAMSGMAIDPPLVDGLVSLMPRLAQGYQLGLICDTGLSPGWMLRRHMHDHGILRYFSHLTFSDELGVSKPHPNAFLTTLDCLGASPEVAVHIGDYPRTDIAGAQGVGMRAIRFAGVHDWHDSTVRADATISSYSQLEPLLQTW